MLKPDPTLSLQWPYLMAKYEELVGKCYQEPVGGKFEDITPTILKELGSSTSAMKKKSLAR